MVREVHDADRARDRGRNQKLQSAGEGDVSVQEVWQDQVDAPPPAKLGDRVLDCRRLLVDCRSNPRSPENPVPRCLRPYHLEGILLHT